MRHVAVWGLLTLSAWRCTLEDVEVGAGEGTSPEASQDVVDEAAAIWVGTTTSGVEVSVRPNRVPVLVGRTHFEITFGSELPKDTPVSIDVISPEMPVMGLLRYAAEPSGPNRYTVAADIRMDGAWEIYVNLGDGTDSAPLAFDVQPGSADGPDHTMGHADTPGA